MKKVLVLLLAAAAAGSALAQPSVGVSIGINQPGVYGRVNIGNVPPPALVLPQPVIIERPRVVVERAPIYLYVPPAHQQNWRAYCGRYAACGQPVYFVQDRWVRERYSHEHPGWDRHHPGRDDHGPGHGHGNGKGHGKGKDHGRGNGHGHDRGH